MVCGLAVGVVVDQHIDLMEVGRDNAVCGTEKWEAICRRQSSSRRDISGPVERWEQYTHFMPGSRGLFAIGWACSALFASQRPPSGLFGVAPIGAQPLPFDFQLQ